MQENFAAWIKTEAVFEGGFVDDPKDPGGRTDKGVTQGTYNAWRRAKGLPPADVKGIPDADRDTIFKGEFWDAAHCDELPAGLDVVVGDGAINSGPAQATKWLQKGLGVTPDGKIGAKTREALAAVNDIDALIDRVVAARVAYLRALRTFGRFGKGWLSRCDQIKRMGQALAMGSVGPQPVFMADMHRKAPLAHAKAIPATSPGAGTGGAGAAVAATSAGAQTVWGQIKEHLTSIASFTPHVSDIVTLGDHAVAQLTAVCGIGGLAIAGVGGAWFYINRRRAAALREALDLNPPASATAGAPA